MLTSLSFLDPGQEWPPASEHARLDQYRDNALLFAGEHPEVFNDWYRLLRKDQRATLEIVVNLTKRVSTLWADLLVGEPPRFSAADEKSTEQDAIDRLVDDNELATTMYELALDISRFGDGLLLIRLEPGRSAIIEAISPQVWFPVVNPTNVRDITAHVLGWTYDVGAGREKRTYLRAQIHTPGRIEHRLYELEQGRIRQQLDGAAVEPGWRDVEETKVAEPLVIQVPGLRTSDQLHGMDDYGDIISIVQEMSARVAQISRILDKHADPSMYGGAENTRVDPKTGETAVDAAGGTYFVVQDGDQPPGYVTWDGQLTAAFTELERLLELFYITSETTPAAFGQLKAGLAESGSALKRLLLAPLAKVNRIRLRVDPRVRQAIQLAADLERLNGRATPEIPSITIDWNDGLPEDIREAVQLETWRVGAGIGSRYSAVQRLDGGDDESIQEEIDRIDEDQAGAAGRAPGAMAPGRLALNFGDNGGQ